MNHSVELKVETKLKNESGTFLNKVFGNMFDHFARCLFVFCVRACIPARQQFAGSKTDISFRRPKNVHLRLWISTRISSLSRRGRTFVQWAVAVTVVRFLFCPDPTTTLLSTFADPVKKESYEIGSELRDT